MSVLAKVEREQAALPDPETTKLAQYSLRGLLIRLEAGASCPS